ncbi:MAG: hypothetical protein J6B04_00480 [Clostridia bacterium]|nr:hypothetical protein [Clostridia bacterium]
MPKLNTQELHERLLKNDKLRELVEYVYKINGASAARLNYRDAAKALNVAKNTIGAYVLKLVILEVFDVDDGTIKINTELFED